MARPLRLDYADTYYHVLSRGNEKREIYRDEKDYLRFLEGLGKMVGRFQLEIHAYVLMGNHYHLLLHTQDAILSRAIQWLGVSYSVW
ncbi:MAG: transposase, partial [bacterium]